MVEIWAISIAVILLCALVGFIAWTSHGRLVALDERCNNAMADIDVLLKHRHRLIPNLVETVKAFATHEHSVLTEVTKARAAALNSHGAAKLEAETQLGQNINTILQVVEKYPEIHASGHFRDLRAELVDTENRITASRRFYNLAVDEYNATLRQFPGNKIGAMAKLDRRGYLELIGDTAFREDPALVSF